MIWLSLVLYKDMKLIKGKIRAHKQQTLLYVDAL